MKLPHYFVSRPVLATVISAAILLAGLLALPLLPVSEYPEVAPPSVVVRAMYPGASPQVAAETVATPLEQAINGVEHMIYLSSQTSLDGAVSLTVTFDVGTDVDLAQIQVQNRVAQALSRLPEEVRVLGVTTAKSTSEPTLVVQLTSPDGRYDPVYLRNYAALHVRDVLARLSGIAQVNLQGAGDYAMRIWLDPDALAERGLTPGDVVRVIREQNVQVAAGALGRAPMHTAVARELTVNVRGRLTEVVDFERIVLRAGPEGDTVRLGDVARIELGAADYASVSLLNNKESVSLTIYQSPESNAIAVSDSVNATMQQLQRQFPEGLDYSVPYDPTTYVRQSIRAVVVTLFEAVVLVVLVVVLFLKTWRASIIPLAAVPVSIVGTLAVMLALGYSINALTLFGLVLSIGIVVDDAIVVVENVERHVERGLSPREAAHAAMSEVSAPVIAIALVLSAVFVPVAFVPGLTGQFYRQFALTIAIATLISAFNSLTLSPALAAAWLRAGADGTAGDEHFTRRGGLARVFAWFDTPFRWVERRYRAAVSYALDHKRLVLTGYLGVVLLTILAWNTVPRGFIPMQDKQNIVAIAQLPEGASLERTTAVARRMTVLAREMPGVQDVVAFPGRSIGGFGAASNAALLFISLKPFEERRSGSLYGLALVGQLNEKFATIRDGFVAALPPSPVPGLGALSGVRLQILDVGNAGYAKLHETTQELLAAAAGSPLFGRVFTSYQVNVPQVLADVDRSKAKSQDVSLGEVFETLQVFLGSLYVNDFNRFGRTYQVIVQADAPYRLNAEDVLRYRTRNASGEMVPLETFLKLREDFGPVRVMHYNGVASSDVTAQPARGVTTTAALRELERIARATLPIEMEYEWTGASYEESKEGASRLLVLPLCIVLVYLVLAGLYESWTLPLPIILMIPPCVLSALGAVWVVGGDNNIFVQIALLVLIALGCKNSILIVEFAHRLHLGGMSLPAAVRQACGMRLRPVLMTSVAFIAGVIPLVLSTGAGAEMRRAIGVAVFGGMLGVTVFGLLLTPVFMLLSQRPNTRES